MKKQILSRFLAALPFIAMALTAALPALADGISQPWEIQMQPAASPVAERMHEFHTLLLWIIGGVTVFVGILLLIVIFRFNKWVNPKPALFAHNTVLEVLWTVVPIVILLVIAVPSFKLLYYVDRVPPSEMTLKVVANQWYWTYEYPDQGGISFTSNLIPEQDIDPKKGQIRLLSTDNPLVLPVETTIQIIVASNDVMHSFTVPSMGIKKDAVPGRLNETWVRIEKPGTYFGQCSQICGKNHAFMPIEIRALSKDDFNAWVVEAKKKYGVSEPTAEKSKAEDKK